MENYKYERYTIRLNKDVKEYLVALSTRRGISPTALIKTIIGEYKEEHTNGR